MQDLTNKYLELSTINTNRNKDIPAVLTYKGDNITANDAYSKLTVFKFNVISSNFPTFLPDILNPTENATYKPYIPFNVKEDDVIVIRPPVDFSYYITDWTITIASSDPITNVTTYRNTYVIFPIESKYFPEPIQYDTDNYISEDFRLSNNIFWGNSEMLCEMITLAFDNITVAGTLQFVKNGSYWSILQRTNVNTSYQIFFNDAMRNYFSFDCRAPTYGLKLKRKNITTIDNIDYYANTSLQTNIKLFPFRNVRFSYDDGLNIFPMWIFTQSTLRNENPFENVLSQYTLNVTDINTVGNCIEFTTNTKDRYISLNNNKTSNFNINVQFITAKRNIYNLKLKYLDEINILFMFD